MEAGAQVPEGLAWQHVLGVYWASWVVQKVNNQEGPGTISPTGQRWRCPGEQHRNAFTHPSHCACVWMASFSLGHHKAGRHLACDAVASHLVCAMHLRCSGGYGLSFLISAEHCPRVQTACHRYNLDMPTFGGTHLVPSYSCLSLSPCGVSCSWFWKPVILPVKRLGNSEFSVTLLCVWKLTLGLPQDLGLLACGSYLSSIPPFPSTLSLPLSKAHLLWATTF